LAFSKDFLKDDNLTISLNVRDLFNSRKRDQFTIAENFTSNSSFQWRVRQVTATVVYRFNQQKREQNRRSNDDDGDFGGS